MTRQVSYRWLSYLGCLAMAFLFCLKFSLTTSFLYDGLHGADSAIFYIIGKYWAQGSIPYIDLWDHKGPVIFFINCIGYLLTENKTGVFILQVVSLSVFLYFVFLTFRTRFSQLVSALLTLVSLFWLACSYEGGNLTEEYLLPYLAAAFYFTVKWLDKRENTPTDHNPWQAFLLGFILGFSLLTRLTNALSACGIMLAVAILLIIEKRWGNLWRNILFYILGFTVIVAPFCIYFALHHALKEMLFGSFFFNFENIVSTTQKSAHLAFGYKNLFLFAVMSANSLVLLLLSIYSLIADKPHRISAFVWLIASIPVTLWLLSSNLSSHYRTIIVPFFPVLVISLFNSKCINSLKYPVITLLICGPIIITGKKWTSFVDYFDDRATNQILCAYINESSAQNSDSFVGYAINQGVYIDLNKKPCYRNFSFQETQAVKSVTLKQDIIQEFSSLKATHILVHGNDVLIQDILQSSYTPLPASTELPEYQLWVRRNTSDEGN